MILMSYLSSEMMAEVRKVTLKSFDNELLEVEEAVAMESQVLKSYMEEVSGDAPIHVFNVTAKILAKVIDYCTYHLDSQKDDDKSEEDVKSWDRDFVKVHQDTLFDLLLAANYLDINNLLDITCQAVADMMKGKSPEDIREIFNLKNDYTAEEEAEVRKENGWDFG